MLKKLKGFIPNLSLFIGSFALIYLLLEYLIFPHVLMFLPLKCQQYLPFAVETLAQNSKRSLIPRDYIAIVGDSFSVGAGDWAESILDTPRNLPYSSAHLIYERTGYDTIAWGKPAAGSLEGMVMTPIRRYEAINAAGQFDIAPPRYMLVYFYEGNDLADNVFHIETYFKDKYHYDPNKVYDPVYLRDYIQSVLLNRKGPDQSAGDQLASKSLLGGFLFNICSAIMKKDNVNTKTAHHPQEIKTEKRKRFRHFPQRNVFSVNDQDIRIFPTHAPPLFLTTEENNLGLYVFEQSLIYLQQYFPQTKMIVVYIPATLSCYRLSSKDVVLDVNFRYRYFMKRQKRFAKELVYEKSDWLSAEIKEISLRQKVDFIDPRPIIRQVAAHKLLHGPTDWIHFNKDGYALLADVIVDFMNDKEYLDQGK